MPKCVECGARLPTVGVRPTWMTCRFCGGPICIDCARIHFPKCMATQWGFATVDPETGELTPVERPPSFSMS